MKPILLVFGVLLAVALVYSYPEQQQYVEVVDEQVPVTAVETDGHARSKRGVALLAHPVLAPLALGFAAGGLLALAKRGWGWNGGYRHYHHAPTYHHHSSGWGWQPARHGWSQW